MDIIKTEKAPKAIGPYNQAVEVDSFIYCSAQLGLDPTTGELVEGIEAQTRQAMNNIDAILKAARLNLFSVFKTTIYLKNVSDFEKVNAIYGSYFTSHPARTCVEVSNLPKGGLIAIEVIAHR